MVRVNCESVVVLSRALLRGMLDRKRGGILNVASTSGHQPTPFMSTYGASKAFVLSFTLALAEELRGSGVHALVLCPGPVPTGFQAAASMSQSSVVSFASFDAHTVVERALDAYARRTVLKTPGLGQQRANASLQGAAALAHRARSAAHHDAARSHRHVARAVMRTGPD